MANEVMRSPFNNRLPSFSSESLKSMRHDTIAIAHDLGLHTRNQVDAFRHSYVGAKLRQTLGLIPGNGLLAKVLSGVSEAPFVGANSTIEHIKDIKSANFGIDMLPKVQQQAELLAKASGLSKIQQAYLEEYLLRSRLAQAVKAGQVRSDTPQPVDPERRNPVSPKPSLAEVFVHAYDRSTGHVRDHQRHPPHHKK